MPELADPSRSFASDIEAAVACLRAADEVVLACHVNPDGDALGSMLGFFHAWTASGRRAIASFSEPFVVATHYRDVPGLDRLTHPADYPQHPPVMVTFDCGSRGRLGDLEPAAAAAGELVVLDHHLSNERYGSINVIDPDAPATAAVVIAMLDALDIPLTRDAALGLYIGLVCDTGRFQYSATTPETFALAQRLAEFDLPISDVGRHLFDEHRFAYLQMLGEVLADAQFLPDEQLVWATVPAALQHKHGVAFEELEGAIDVVRSAREAEVACILKEDGLGVWRGSMRSVGDVDVSRIAAQFGGGGHRFAAGFTSTEQPDFIIERIRVALAAR